MGINVTRIKRESIVTVSDIPKHMVTPCDYSQHQYHKV